MTKRLVIITVMKMLPTVIGGFLFLSTWSFVSFAQAASLYLDPAQRTLNSGDSVTMAVRLDVDEQAEECVNTVDAVIEYSGGIEPVDVSVGESIFNIWVEEPTINKENKTITFAGGIPNGYCGRVIGDPRLTNVLAEIVFRSPGFMIGSPGTDDSEAVVSFADNSAAYLNDGRGTRARLATYDARIELTNKPGAILQNDWKEEVENDKISPEEFSISLQKDPKIFSQKWYIVFNTSDKQTGIDHYEIYEEPISKLSSFEWGSTNVPWIVDRSPFILQDQTLNSIIRVKAVDKAGNEYISTLVPDESLRTTSSLQIFDKILKMLLLIFIILLMFFTYKVVKKRRRKVAALNDTESPEEENQPNKTTNDFDK